MRRKLTAICLTLALAAAPASAYDMARPEGAAAVSAGAYHTAAVDGDGTLWTWGDNSFGELGHGRFVNAVSRDAALSGVAAVSCGDYHTAAILTDRTLWMWGSDRMGELGAGGTGDRGILWDEEVEPSAAIPVRSTPVKVMEDVAAVSCGQFHTAALKLDGTLWMWGSDREGELGIGGGGNDADADGLPVQTVPVQVLDRVTAVSCGAGHTAAIREDGTLWAWGYDLDGQVGDGGAGDALDYVGRPIRTTPAQVLDRVTAVSCGAYFTAAIREDGTLWTWGYNGSGELGNGGEGNSTFQEAAGLDFGPDIPIQTVPARVPSLEGVAYISCGYSHAAAVLEDGTLWTWGYNFDGQLGNKSTRDEPRPVKVMDGAAAVSCGYDHTAAVKTDGTLWLWGRNKDGELGFFDANARNGERDPIQTAPRQMNSLTVARLTAPPVEIPELPPEPLDDLAHPNTSAILLDGRVVELDMYALWYVGGGVTNYVRVRDLAPLLTDTQARFNVDWTRETGIFFQSRTGYVPPAGEPAAPPTGDQPYTVPELSVPIDGEPRELAGFALLNGSHTYYQLRDLGAALGFNVYWDETLRMVCVDTAGEYTGLPPA